MDFANFDYTDLLKKVRMELKMRDFEEKFYSEDETTTSFLKEQLNSAIQDVNEARRFTPDYKEKKYYDKNYENKIIKIVIIEIAKIGVEGQKSHSENGISRAYEDRDEILNNIPPLVHIFENS